MTVIHYDQGSSSLRIIVCINICKLINAMQHDKNKTRNHMPLIDIERTLKKLNNF